jgi:hypothetical protein
MHHSTLKLGGIAAVATAVLHMGGAAAQKPRPRMA